MARGIRGGSFSCGDDQKHVICGDLLQGNATPQPVVWSNSAEDLLTGAWRPMDAIQEIRGNQ